MQTIAHHQLLSSVWNTQFEGCTSAKGILGSSDCIWPQGDVLSGTLAAFKSWAVNNPESAEDAARKLGLRPALLACWAACATVRQVEHLPNNAFKRFKP
jgi:hypothetical protein